MAVARPIIIPRPLEDAVIPAFIAWRREVCVRNLMLSYSGTAAGGTDPKEIAESEERADAALNALIGLRPETPAGIAALAEVLYDLIGPEAQFGTTQRAEQMTAPEVRLIAAIWAGARRLQEAGLAEVRS